jgi:hypothetical protein
VEVVDLHRRFDCFEALQDSRFVGFEHDVDIGGTDEN